MSTNNNLFIACKEGALDRAKEIYSLDKATSFDLNRAFESACQNGHLDVAQWLHPLGRIELQGYWYYSFCLACQNSHLNIVRWISSLITVSTEMLTLGLHYVKEEDLNMLQILLENGANIHCGKNKCFKKFILWENKLEVYQILLQYCKEEWYHLMDEDIVCSLLNPIKSARKV